MMVYCVYCFTHFPQWSEIVIYTQRTIQTRTINANLLIHK